MKITQSYAEVNSAIRKNVHPSISLVRYGSGHKMVSNDSDVQSTLSESSAMGDNFTLNKLGDIALNAWVKWATELVNRKYA